jgi:hypothetical protein
MTQPMRWIASLVAVALTASAAHAEDKTDAKALMLSGVKLLEAKDYLGALAIFKDAYARFPSTKILLNIATTLKLLDRRSEAANTYQHYLDAPDADPAKRADVQAAIDDLDKAIGRLAIEVTPADAEIQVGDGEWTPAAKAKLVRVEAGAFTVRARRATYNTEAKSANIAPGEKAAVVIAMSLSPNSTSPPDTHVDGKPPDQSITVGVQPETPARFAAFALALLDIPRGGAGLVGGGFNATDSLQIRAAAILGPSYGAFAGATFSFLKGDVHPIITAGMPVFFSNGARFAVRGGAGAEISASKRVDLILELGYEHYINPEMGYRANLFVPGVGVRGKF